MVCSMGRRKKESVLSADWRRTMNHSSWWHKFRLCGVQFSLGYRWYAVSLLCKRFARSIEGEDLNCTLKRQKRRGLKLSFPFRSSRERNSISWSINSGSEKYSKMIFSPWATHKHTPNVITVILRHQWEILCVARYEQAPHSSPHTAGHLLAFQKLHRSSFLWKERETKKRLLWFIDNNAQKKIWIDTYCLQISIKDKWTIKKWVSQQAVRTLRQLASPPPIHQCFYLGQAVSHSVSLI